jgi:predicted N-formylglutamate amidohydrolase
VIRDFFLITCEHGGTRIPSRYRPMFNDYESLLSTHRAYDAGALRMARDLSCSLQAPLRASTINRLLIDLNRSITHPRVYSDVTRSAPIAVREEIRQRYYQDYRGEVELQIGRSIAAGHRAIHISCHSFTPEFEGKRRDADIGLLYDPARSGESALCRRWRAAIKAQMPSLKVRMNYPYAGKSDGLTSSLRRRFAPEWYLGIELEINQSHVFEKAGHWRRIRQTVITALCEVSARSHDHDFS